MESVWSVSKLSTESVVSRRELVSNSVHIADATQLSSAVCIGYEWASVYCSWCVFFAACRTSIRDEIRTAKAGTGRSHLCHMLTGLQSSSYIPPLPLANARHNVVIKRRRRMLSFRLDMLFSRRGERRNDAH